MTRLLLHVCCAPCMMPSLDVLVGLAPWERVLPEAPDFEPVVWFYNPNITDLAELRRRKEALLSVMKQRYPHVPVLDDESERDREHWLVGASLLKDEPERGKRCVYCYGYRLFRAFVKAREHGLEAVTTTLTLSPLKNTGAIHAIGASLERRFGISYIAADFKKQDGVKRSRILCEQYGVYRQNFCGCEFSKRSRA